MQLFTTFGVQSSVPPKTVVAVINPGVEGSTLNYNGTIIPNGLYDLAAGQVVSSSASYYSKTALINNSLYISSTSSNIALHFWNNSTYIGWYEFGNFHGSTENQLGNITDLNNITIPNNSTHFGASMDAGSTFIASYDNPATTSNYQLTYQEFQTFSPVNGDLISHSDTWSIAKTSIIGNSIITNKEYLYIHFWNNDTYLGQYSDHTTAYNQLGTYQIGTITVPNNATHFATSYDRRTLSFHGGSNPYTTDVIISYNNPAVQTVTFFDEYPNGTQIGNVVDVVASTAQYSYNFINPGIWNNYGNFEADSKFIVTSKIVNIDNSIILSNTNIFGIHFWQDNTYLGHEVYHSDSYWNINKLTSRPTNYTHFAISFNTGVSSPPPNGTFNDFQQLVISYSVAATVDPPATYKIRQLVFEE